MDLLDRNPHVRSGGRAQGGGGFYHLSFRSGSRGGGASARASFSYVSRGLEHNPHAHLMFSERQNDGIERSRDMWFRRANSKHPERGGAPKSRTFHGPAWIEQARHRWAALTNKALERAGRSERVDHRSYERQGVDRDPGEHYGPAAAHVVGRGDDHDRLGNAVAVLDHEQAIRAIDGQIARLEAARETILRDGLPDAERQPEQRDYSRSQFSNRTDEGSWER